MNKRHAGLPSRQQILDFITQSDVPAGKREIARAFNLKGQDRIALKALLRDMADEGLIDSSPGRAFHMMGGVPKVTVLRIADVDDSGTPWGVPERWEAESAPPRLRVIEKKGRAALGVGDRVLVRTEEGRSGWTATIMKKLLKGSELVLGVVHQEGDQYWLRPVDRKERRLLSISDLGDAGTGDLVLAEKVGRPPRLSARVDTRLGDPFAPRSFSLIAIHKYDIPHVFPEAAIEEADRVSRLDLGEREDLTGLPIIAIDPADARDHDDAVWAAPDDDPANAGGWKAIVAIADVSFYVRPGSALDKEARRRGNSVYFPDRVVPMLPETLSADMCSLKEGQARAALAAHLVIGKDGKLKSWRFSRAKVRIAANIAYEDAQAAIDLVEGRGGPSAEELEDMPEAASSPCALTDADLAGRPPVEPELVEKVLKPLWACWRALDAARSKREPLDLDLPERRVLIDESGRIVSVAVRERLDAHRLIEEYMIAANVAAAKALESRKNPVMYRVHLPPSREKLVALKDYLKTFDIEFALGQVIRPATFNHLLKQVRDSDVRPQIMEQVLRTQTQAYYSPENHGHFGLALGSYAHFTSPIRRYSDLVVHRSLVRAFGLGPEARDTGLTDRETEAMEVTAELISNHERRAMEAERDTIDRYVAAFLADQVGQLVQCRITGVQPFGFFATVTNLGGDGLVPVSTLGEEYFRYDEASQSLVGEESGETYAPGQVLTLRLAEADPVSGSLRFEIPDRPATSRSRGPRGPEPGKRMQGRRGRPPNIRHRGRK